MRMLDSEFLLLVSTVDPPSLTGKKLTPSSNRYFLITPKLLTGLRYDERMKVLCINNGTSTCAVRRRIDSVIDENAFTPTAFTGEYLPDSHTCKGPGPGDLLAFLQKRREKKAARGRAA
jgi:hypothetical protein